MLFCHWGTMPPHVALNLFGMQSFVPKLDRAGHRRMLLKGAMSPKVSLYLSAPGYSYQKYKAPSIFGDVLSNI